MTALYGIVFAHFLSDFVLQSDHLVAAKRTLKARAHLLHGGVVALATSVLAWAASGHAYIALACTVGLVHLVQDLLKDRLRASWSAGAAWMWTAADQLVHLAVIGALADLFGVARPLIVVSRWLPQLRDPVTFQAAILLVMGTWVAGVLLREVLAPLVPPSRIAGVASGTEGFQPASAEVAATKATQASSSPTFVRTSFWIGIVERVIVVAAVAAAGGRGLATAGLVVAAKSVFRWRDLDRDPQAVQYFLLGTLASVAVAVVDGLLMRHVLG